MSGIPGELFTNVPVDLFRIGNASGPRLENVRPIDVDTVDQVLPNGQVIRMVYPRGGISTFDRIVPKRPGKWWRIPADALYDASAVRQRAAEADAEGRSNVYFAARLR